MNSIEAAPGVGRSDAELLREFVETNSDDAFSELISRHSNWVFSVALRQVGSRTIAEDATQAAFTILAQKARTLKPQTLLSGWLFRVVRYTAIDAMRIESRRRQREEQFAASTSNDDDPQWEEIAPMLDACVSKLRSSDQRAILLRYYEEKSWRDVGAALGLNENAARVRVERALEKLRTLMGRRGVASTTSGLHSMLEANCVQFAGPGVSLPQGGETITAIVHAVLRRWFIRKIAIASFVACLFLCAASFYAIPKSQNGSQTILLGNEAFAALVDIDHGLWNGEAAQFLGRIHFRDATDESYREVLRQFVLAQAESRRAPAKSAAEQQAKFDETVKLILRGRSRPTEIGVFGDRAAGAFSRGRGIDLVRVNGIWKWDFFNGFPKNRLEQLRDEISKSRTIRTGSEVR